MKTITITFIMDNSTFMWIWYVFSKQGGHFNEFLVDNYINEIAENFPDVDKVIPKIYGVSHTIKFIFGMNNIPGREYEFYRRLQHEREFTYNKLKEEFFVEKSKIKNPIEVGI